MAKRGWLLVGIAAAVVVAWFVPAASAKSSPRVRLPLIPLPKAALGLAAHGLALAHDSGVISNTAAANRSFSSPPPARFKQMGRIIGYGLAYGDEATGSAGVDSVWTSVDEYKNAKDANRGIAFRKKDDALVTELNQGTFSVTNGLVKVPALGSARFGDLTSYTAASIAPVSSFDEEVAEGRYVLDVTVSAGTASEAVVLGTKLAKKLDQRLELARAGRLQARPVKLPCEAEPWCPRRWPRSVGDGPHHLGSQRAGDHLQRYVRAQSAGPVGLHAVHVPRRSVRLPGPGDPLVRRSI